jgi:hypothetical protein
VVKEEEVRALLYLIIERSRIIICEIFHGGHDFSGPDGYDVAGCTRCFHFKESKITNKRILEVFKEREALGLGFFEDLPA